MDPRRARGRPVGRAPPDRRHQGPAERAPPYPHLGQRGRLPRRRDPLHPPLAETRPPRPPHLKGGLPRTARRQSLLVRGPPPCLSRRLAHPAAAGGAVLEVLRPLAEVLDEGG